MSEERAASVTGHRAAVQRPVLDIWREARDSSDDIAEQNRRWRWLMIANGHLTDSVWQDALGHRILAAHGPGETCDDCPCWHCGATGSDPDGDHSCPCPHHDNDCPWHVNPMGKRDANDGGSDAAK